MVYMARTNIDIDDELIQRVMSRYGLRTKREAVDLALRRLVGEPLSLEEALAMGGTGWEADLDELRGADRPAGAVTLGDTSAWVEFLRGTGSEVDLGCGVCSNVTSWPPRTSC